MDIKTLFVAWQDRSRTRGWYPIGRLDVDHERPLYRFRYVRGALRARETANFSPLLDFPEFGTVYEDSTLFPFFQNRVIAQSRPDFGAYLANLGLSLVDPIAMLAVGGGERATDAFEVFPKLVPQSDGTLCCRFFLHGNRHTNAASIDRVMRLERGEPLRFAMEWANPATGEALQIQTNDYYMIGWAPRYLVEEFTSVARSVAQKFELKVVRVNKSPAPAKQRLLIELTSAWPGRELMNTGDFELLSSALNSAAAE